MAERDRNNHRKARRLCAACGPATATEQLCDRCFQVVYLP